MIDILLSTFNGEKFIQDLLESLKAQTFRDFRLLIRDDGSNDNTIDIIRNFEKERTLNMEFIPGESNIGAVSSFGLLFEKSDADYIMFCDQDDVWMPQKIERTFAAMQKAEAANDADTPILVFTNLKVVDENLNLLNESFFKYQRLNTGRLALSQQLVQNIPCGCTMLLNRALVKQVGKIPSDAVMHDHWVSLVTSVFGKFVFIDEATILYRQHKHNTFGANQYGWSYFYKKWHSGIYELKARFYLNINQAKAFRLRYGNELSPENCGMLDDFIDIRQKSWIKRRRILYRHKIYKSGWARNIGVMLIV